MQTKNKAWPYPQSGSGSFFGQILERLSPAWEGDTMLSALRWRAAKLAHFHAGGAKVSLEKLFRFSASRGLKLCRYPCIISDAFSVYIFSARAVSWFECSRCTEPSCTAWRLGLLLSCSHSQAVQCSPWPSKRTATVDSFTCSLKTSSRLCMCNCFDLCCFTS